MLKQVNIDTMDRQLRETINRLYVSIERVVKVCNGNGKSKVDPKEETQIIRIERVFRSGIVCKRK